MTISYINDDQGFLTNCWSNLFLKRISWRKKIHFESNQPPSCIAIMDADRKSSVIYEVDRSQIPTVIGLWRNYFIRIVKFLLFLLNSLDYSVQNHIEQSPMLCKDMLCAKSYALRAGQKRPWDDLILFLWSFCRKFLLLIPCMGIFPLIKLNFPSHIEWKIKGLLVVFFLTPFTTTKFWASQLLQPRL